jgi:hypothetical protein
MAGKGNQPNATEAQNQGFPVPSTRQARAAGGAVYGELLTTVGAEMANQFLGDVADVLAVGYSVGMGALHKINPKAATFVENLDWIENINEFIGNNHHKNDRRTLVVNVDAKTKKDAEDGTPNSAPNVHKKYWNIAADASVYAGIRLAQNAVKSFTVYPAIAYVLSGFALKGAAAIAVPVMVAGVAFYGMSPKDKVKFKIVKDGVEEEFPLNLTKILMDGGKLIAEKAVRATRRKQSPMGMPSPAIT